MSIVRWNPFRELDEMQASLNRLLGERSQGFDDKSFFSGWAPAVDIQETDAEYLIKADLPDVKKEDVKVEFENGTLVIQGERQQEKEEKGKKFHRVERAYGKFVRRFAMPTEVDLGRVSADFKEGVLMVHLPKSPVAKPKTIDIKVA